VTGVLKRRDCGGLAVRVHVRVTVISPGGNAIYECCSEDTYVMRRMIGRSPSLKRFLVRFSEVPPKGFTIHLTVELS
jgi:hypothetical protein